VSSALAAPRLRRIVVAYAINRLGSWIGTIALSLAVFDHTHSALAVAATLVAAQVLPAFAVPPLVAKVEASKRRRELSGLYFIEAGAAAGLAVLLGNFWLAGVLALVAVDGTAALVASALLRTEAARAGREELGSSLQRGADAHEARGHDAHAGERDAAAAINVAFSVTFVLGPVLGGVITANAGASAALLTTAVAFLACGALLMDLHPHVEAAAGESIRGRLRAAWRHVQSVPTLRALLLIQAVALIFFESAMPIEVVYAKVTLHVGDRGFGLLGSVWGVGVVIGAIAFSRSSRQPLGLMISAGTLAVALAYVGFGAAGSLVAACVAALVGGVGNGVQWAPLVSAVQRLTPPALQGRVMGGLESIGALAPALGLVLGGALVALSTPRTAFFLVGAGAAFTTVAFAYVTLSDSPQWAPVSTIDGLEADRTLDGAVGAPISPDTRLGEATLH
jgi:MFS family permease